MTEEVEKEYEVKDFTEVRGKIPEKALEERAYYRDVYFGKHRPERIRLRLKRTHYPEEKEEAILTKKSPEIKEGLQKAEETERKVSDFHEKFEELKKSMENLLSTKNWRSRPMNGKAAKSI